MGANHNFLGATGVSGAPQRPRATSVMPVPAILVFCALSALGRIAEARSEETLHRVNDVLSHVLTPRVSSLPNPTEPSPLWTGPAYHEAIYHLLLQDPELHDRILQYKDRLQRMINLFGEEIVLDRGRRARRFRDGRPDLLEQRQPYTPTEHAAKRAWDDLLAREREYIATQLIGLAETLVQEKRQTLTGLLHTLGPELRIRPQGVRDLFGLADSFVYIYQPIAKLPNQGFWDRLFGRSPQPIADHQLLVRTRFRFGGLHLLNFRPTLMEMCTRVHNPASYRIGDDLCSRWNLLNGQVTHTVF